MLNIIGGKHLDSHDNIMQIADAIPDAQLHMYGKESKPARKIGHITVRILSIAIWYILVLFNLIQLIASSMREAEREMAPLIHLTDVMRAERKALPIPSAIPTSLSSPQPLVGVTMGSDSDLNVLKLGLELLKKFEVPYFLTITSAHRTPHRMIEFAESAAEKGFKVLIAAAGGAAHLPGMLASDTPIPVIGVPVKGSTLDGMDSLLSIVQMPRGVPVATVSINNSINAALLAIRILGTSDPELQEKMVEYMRNMEKEVDAKAAKLEEVGFENY